MEPAIEIIFTEDKDLFRKAVVRELVDYNVYVSGEAANGKELLLLLKHKRPDVVVLDLDMPVMNGSETLDRLMKDFPETKVLILTLYNEPLLIDNFMTRGARGFIPKDQVAGDIEILVRALHLIHQGGIYIHPSTSVHRFSKRQTELMPLMFEGKTNEEIASETGPTKRGVEKSRRGIYEKSGSGKAVHFYKFAFSKGLQFLARVMPGK